ncbi:MAG TPA: AbrB/MazE/SpoVT family DNA-binding domain-containing protein [Candidatus Nanoarchaeia archaeon]|nr:AbrB/MazE/SpoVT family DNA-binding domain-containing protein [Candidatus Nanoarchaeia archaeon]
MEQVTLSKKKDPPRLKIYKVKLGKKGQLTVPKKIRDVYKLKEKDTFILTLVSEGELLIKKSVEKRPVDHLFEFIDSLPPIDWDKAWEEMLEDRKKEHR